MPRRVISVKQQQQQLRSGNGGLLKTLVLAAISFGMGTTLSGQESFLSTQISVRDLSTGEMQQQPLSNVRRAAEEAKGARYVDPSIRQASRNALALQEQNIVPVAQTLEEAVQYCREKVFGTNQNSVSDDVIHGVCHNNKVWRTHGVCQDLIDFTGMTMEEVIERMKRQKNYHFQQEHLFWNPQSTTQLAWYYATSQSYMFANAIHTARIGVLSNLKKDIHEPVFDYSGGVGETVLHLAIDRGMKCQYFGIGMIEKEFAQFRVAKKGLRDLITFVHPWSERTGFSFDPIKVLPRDKSLGSIVATDVLEHIPNYHVVVNAMVDSLRVGGVIVENTPFASAKEGDGPDLRIHVGNGGISMEEAMGGRMIFREKEMYWEKIKE